jgi:hypothetical protein
VDIPVSRPAGPHGAGLRRDRLSLWTASRAIPDLDRSFSLRPLSELKLPAADKASLKAAELRMAKELVGSMTEKWKPGGVHRQVHERHPRARGEAREGWSNRDR